MKNVTFTLTIAEAEVALRALRREGRSADKSANHAAKTNHAHAPGYRWQARVAADLAQRLTDLCSSA